MLPNRTVAISLASLMALSLVPVTDAQASASTDLVTSSVSLDHPVVNETTDVTITVHNQGTRAFAGSFTVFVGWKNATHSADCLTASDTTSTTGQLSPPCYVQFINANIPAGGDASGSFTWTIPPIVAFDNHGTVVIATNIQNGPCTDLDQGCRSTNPTGLTGTQGTGPDDQTGNNIKPFPQFVKTPKVRAYPLRAAPKAPADNVPSYVNDPWPETQVTDACHDAPDVTGFGCTVEPGHAFTSVYHVMNLGNAPDTFSPDVSVASAVADDFKDFTLSVSPPTKYLDVGQGADIRITILVPQSAPAGRGFNVGTVTNLSVAWVSAADTRIRSDNDPAATNSQDCPQQLVDAQECGRSTILPFLVTQKHGLNLSTDIKDNFTTVSEGNATSLDLIVNNTGNAPDSYVVTLDRVNSTIDDTWLKPDSIPPASDGVAPGLSKVLAPYLVPPNATRGYYTVSFAVQSASTDVDVVHVKFTLYLQQTYALSSELDNQLQLVVPGDTASFGMSVSNPGNGPENLTLVVNNQPGGWSWTLSNTSLTLGPQGSSVFYLNASVPPNTPADSQAAFFVNVSSSDPSDHPDRRPPVQTLVPKVTVLHGPNADLSVDAPSQFVDPGNATTYRLHVRNVGNEASNFTIDKDVSDSTWGVTMDPGYLVLNPVNSGATGASEGDVTVTVRAPQGASVGEIERVTLTVAPVTDPGRAKETVLQARISGPDLYAASIGLNTTTPYGGDPVVVSVRVGNQGNHAPAAPVVVSVLATKDGQQIPVGNVTLSAFDLRPNAARDVQIAWDTTGLEGDALLQATIDPANAIPEIDETNNAATRALTLRAANAIRLLPADGLSGHPGEDISYSQPPNVFQLQYTGNQPSEPVRVELSSAHGWIPADKATLNLDLPHLALIPLRVDLTIPPLPGASSDLLTVRVIPVYRPGAVVSATTTTSVVDDQKPLIGKVTVDPATATLGQNVTVYATVTDATGLSSVRANVVTPESDVASLLMLPQADGRYAVTQPWTVAGAYAVTIAAIDNAQPPNVNDTHQPLAQFTITAGSVPTIALAPGQSTTVRTGSPVRLAISDPLGIAKANYTVKGVTYDMGRNYTIDTSGLTSGSYQIAVAAENLYHVPASAAFNITVDNTPPGIRAVTLTPATPKAGQDALVRVETDAKVTGVQVLVKKDGAIAQTLDATRKSPGVFEVTLNPQEGQYTLDVTATDAAGNQKLSEGAVVFSAKADSPFHVPGPETGLLVVAVGLLGLALRRRS